MAKKFMCVCFGILALVVASHLWARYGGTAVGSLVGVAFRHPLLVALASVGAVGYIIQRLTAGWQHEYWQKQHEITCARERRDRKQRRKTEALEDLIRAHYALELKQAWQDWTELPRKELLARVSQWRTAKEFFAMAFYDDEGVKGLLSQPDVVVLTQEQTGQEGFLFAEHLNESGTSLHRLAVAGWKNLMSR